MNDEECMLQCRQGRPEAFRALIDRYWRPLLWQLRLMMGSEAEAEELVADSFVSLLSYVPGWTAEGRVKPLLYTIARRRAFRARQQRARQGVLSLAPPSEPETDELLRHPGPDPEEQLRLAEDLARVDSLLSLRPVNEQRAFQLHFREHLEIEEVARRLETSPGTVRVWLSRTRGAIRQAFQADETCETSSDLAPLPNQKGSRGTACRDASPGRRA